MADVDKFTSTLGANWAGYGERVLTVQTTIDTTSLVAGEDVRLFRVPNGARLKMVAFESADMDTGGTPAFDADFICTDDDGDTILFNAGTAFQTAISSPQWEFLGPHVVNANAAHDAYFSLKVVTAAATGAAAGALKVALIYGGP